MTESPVFDESRVKKPAVWRRVWHALGLILSLAAFVYVVLSLVRAGAPVAQELASSTFIIVVCAGGFFYAAALQFVGAGWWFILIAIGERSLSLWTALAIFGRTQVYKYLPSNLLHMAGRIAEARLKGVGTTTLVLAQLFELALLCGAAGLLAGGIGWRLLLAEIEPIWFSGASVAGALVLFVILGALISWRLLGKRWPGFTARFLPKLSLSFGLYLAFFLLNGLLLNRLAMLHVSTDYSFFTFVAVGSAAWLAGFIVPGAPGGLGVREAIMIGLLGGLGFAESTALIVAISHRLATIVGDGMVALFFFLVRPLLPAFNSTDE